MGKKWIFPRKYSFFFYFPPFSQDLFKIHSKAIWGTHFKPRSPRKITLPGRTSGDIPASTYHYQTYQLRLDRALESYCYHVGWSWYYRVSTTRFTNGYGYGYGYGVLFPTCQVRVVRFYHFCPSACKCVKSEPTFCMEIKWK